ncbi:hypothetical protein Alches_23000 [Alicyclobacillus hesperidum subsp. aegles]|uniref:Uncharacterized protein n=1 Tax=Alicyclobacillus hesperidum TaxID=89784 RepID=A0A1H2Q079_9BACL|nr:hypothetical protein [Alicyclobacillus hesperidum]GLG02259.1 hypothetical protein Alches_23000 [Alicyclobacillus hesperidum subsp. aegles]GLV12882.1 hypothetical protein Heshes_05660 [Alicyclobacillus hesperidum]SDW00507.1 hypothetical protein SAMN04489725_1018 [Alicyclobacillus hesperidum]
MRDSILYLLLAAAFALYLTWRLSSSLRQTLRQRGKLRKEQET